MAPSLPRLSLTLVTFKTCSRDTTTNNKLLSDLSVLVTITKKSSTIWNKLSFWLSVNKTFGAKISRYRQFLIKNMIFFPVSWDALTWHIPGMPNDISCLKNPSDHCPEAPWDLVIGGCHPGRHPRHDHDPPPPPGISSHFNILNWSSVTFKTKLIVKSYIFY